MTSFIHHHTSTLRTFPSNGWQNPYLLLENTPATSKTMSALNRACARPNSLPSNLDLANPEFILDGQILNPIQSP
jgi:hypothetical protein